MHTQRFQDSVDDMNYAVAAFNVSQDYGGPVYHDSVVYDSDVKETSLKGRQAPLLQNVLRRQTARHHMIQQNVSQLRWIIQQIG